MNTILKTVATFAAAVLLLAGTARAQEPSPADSQTRSERLAFMKDQAAEYAVTLKDERGTALALHEEPVLRFSNPVSGVPDGIVVMWKQGKRPAIFAQVFQTKDGLWVHECQSLASSGLNMVKGGQTLWSPQQGVDAFRPLPESTAPAATATRRLPQMKEIAAEFTGSDDFKIHTSDKEPTRHVLRLLTTPVYRYEDADNDVIDGAVFALVHGTDPEVFLVLECRADKDSLLLWHYALTPMTCWALNVTRKNATVWSMPERLNKSTPRDTYHVWLYKGPATGK